MAVQTANELLDYYAKLLILQYYGLPKASAMIETVVTPTVMPQTTVQTIVFSIVSTAGAYKLTWDEQETALIAWNDNAATVQTRLRALTGLASITVTAITGGFQVTFTDVTPPAVMLTASVNTLTGAGSAPVSIAITETDEILPFAVQDGFNVTGDDLAVGDQLDVLGKYVGASRTGAGFSAVITLGDTEFRTLIQIATTLNSMGSSLYEIQNFLQTYFSGQIYVFDYQNMHMSYLIDSSAGSQNLIQLMVTQGFLPKPMAVAMSIIYAANIHFFAFRTYTQVAYPNTHPFNTYGAFHTDWPWLSYVYGISFT